MYLTMAVYGDAPYTNATAVISSPKLKPNRAIVRVRPYPPISLGTLPHHVSHWLHINLRSGSPSWVIR